MQIPALVEVGSRFGAPMGRTSVNDAASYDRPIKILVTRLAWEDGDYDKGGAYWGGGTRTYIFRAYSDKGVENAIDVYVRAANYSDVEVELRKTYKQATFVRVEESSEPLYWNSSEYGNDLQLTLADAESVSRSGQDASPDVDALIEIPYIAAQIKRIAPENLRRELKEFGCWDADELADDQMNLKRWIWLSGNDIKENYRDRAN